RRAVSAERNAGVLRARRRPEGARRHRRRRSSVRREDERGCRRRRGSPGRLVRLTGLCHHCAIRHLSASLVPALHTQDVNKISWPAREPIRAWKEINMRVLHRVVLGVASLGLVAFSAQLARAADGDITAGYSYLYDSDSSTGFPAGWFLSAGAHITDAFAVV